MLDWAREELRNWTSAICEALPFFVFIFATVGLLTVVGFWLRIYL